MTTDVYTRLCNGEKIEDIAKQMEKELNEAKSRYDAEAKAKKEAEAKAAVKRQEFDKAMDSLVAWIVKYYPDLGMKEADFKGAYDEIYKMMGALDGISAVFAGFSTDNQVKNVSDPFEAFFKAYGI